MALEVGTIWMQDSKRCEEDFNKAIEKKQIRHETKTEALIQGHLEKAEHNLKFVQFTLKEKEFNDWTIVSAYYAIYHSALALCAVKGYSSKSHRTTLLIIIKEFYNKTLSQEDIQAIESAALEKEEVLYYINAKQQRTTASYATTQHFNQEEVIEIQKNAIRFLQKTQDIIEQEHHFKTRG